MRAVLWDLLLLCLFARARGDCRGDCLHCDRHLYRDSFDVLICILECEGEAVPRATWQLCAAANRAAPPPRRLREPGEPRQEPAMPPADPLRLLESREDGEATWPDAFRADEEEEEDIGRGPGGSRRGTRGGWRPEATAKGVQKRYGGFIGVRKSARKWNNQKRFSEFLKQYLGMAPRSSEYEAAGGVKQHNEI